ncbi:hypothetical protein DFR70_103384 [Nocardia tenerifensis]|uniref:Uncharacterized protein n=1 Tax=Nocardia tenerifensis TaxID=228006 RepID=A0A318KA10_9NOCA|nr:hypothetical protein DFR70_103384 [Nocardia tenerifensis]
MATDTCMTGGTQQVKPRPNQGRKLNRPVHIVNIDGLRQNEDATRYPPPMTASPHRTS